MLWNAVTSGNTRRIIELMREQADMCHVEPTDAELRERLRHEQQSEPREHAWSPWDDDTGLPKRGPM